MSLPARTYVVAVAVTSLWVLAEPSQLSWALLVVLTLPLSLVAVWVAFYAGLAVGAWTGQGHDEVSLPVALVWVAVWTTTAWIDARLVEKLLAHGWDALRVGPRARDLDEVEDDLS